MRLPLDGIMLMVDFSASPMLSRQMQGHLKRVAINFTIHEDKIDYYVTFTLSFLPSLRKRQG